ALQTAQGIASYVALAWMLYQLLRRPHDVRLRAVTGLVGCWAVAYPFGMAADKGATFVGIEPMTCRLVEHALLLVAAYSLMCFYLFSALEARAARVRALRQTVPLAVAVLILVTATATIP